MLFLFLRRRRVFLSLSSRQVAIIGRALLVENFVLRRFLLPFLFFCWAWAQQVAAHCHGQHGASFWPWLSALWPCHIFGLCAASCLQHMHLVQCAAC